MIARDSVLRWLDDAPASEVEELELWLDDVEFGEELELSPADLDEWWERLVVMAGRPMPHSVETDIRLLLGDVAALADAEGVGHDDGSAVVGVRFREHLVASSRNPAGFWEAELIADRVNNAFIEFESWSGLDPVNAESALRAVLAELLASCDDLLSRTRSVPARRLAQAAGSLCEGRIGEPEAALNRVGEFFRLDQQCERESGKAASWLELVFVTVAGVNAKVALGDLTGVHEVMRLVRLRAEPAGGSMPSMLTQIWVEGLQDLDPAFAQMLAQQLLFDVRVEGESPSDEAFAAAFLLFQAAAAAGDLEHADRLAQEWMPLALAAERGRGSQMWLEVLEAEPDDG